jgi:hypothetical protein
MLSVGMLRRVALVRTAIIRVIRIGELGTTLALTSNRRKLRIKGFTHNSGRLGYASFDTVAVHSGSLLDLTKRTMYIILYM